MDDYLDAIHEHAAEFGAGYAGKYDDYASQEPAPLPWTDEEWHAFQGHVWTERRVVLVKGRLFADLMNIFNPRELREARSIPSWSKAVARVIYRDNEEWHGSYVSSEMAEQCQPWFLGWKK